MALGGHKTPLGWIAQCPAHADRRPSLSISDADDSKVVVDRHAADQEHHREIAVKRSVAGERPAPVHLPIVRYGLLWLDHWTQRRLAPTRRYGLRWRPALLSLVEG
jgi:hypothetical protein